MNNYIIRTTLSTTQVETRAFGEKEKAITYMIAKKNYEAMLGHSEPRFEIREERDYEQRG